jgi:molecular chaperone HtpG
MQKGNIRVQTENIFPIIKKFLYSEHDIFIRELVSNAVDATQKIKTLSSIGEAKGELGELRIDVTLDAANKTLTISDRGVGMTAEEIDKYLNQVAFSGAEEFLEKYKGQNENNIIGHFGLGFYSAFMVSEKVEVVSKSFREGAEAVRWECDGSPEFSLSDTQKDHRGTAIVLHINEESKEFLDSYKIKSTLEKFCKFLPVPIFFTDVNETKEELKEGEEPIVEKAINNPSPAWTKKPSELKKEDYENFYKELYPFSETPLFWIHLNVDFPFNLTGILYFPKIKQSYEIQKDKIQLYSNQVFVTDEVKDIVPEFLMLLHGVIDSPDIPLNVSRSYLQGDPNVKKINAHITKKVADKLDEIFRNDRADFEARVAAGGFLEWAEFAGNLYGTPRQPVEQQLASGRPVLLEIELEGARQVRQSFAQGFQVFIQPPSLAELERRIRGRGTDSDEAIGRRLERARVELAAAAEFDACITNDDLTQALLELERLMQLSC